jgi:hypothetical protein
MAEAGGTNQPSACSPWQIGHGGSGRTGALPDPGSVRTTRPAAVQITTVSPVDAAARRPSGRTSVAGWWSSGSQVGTSTAKAHSQAAKRRSAARMLFMSGDRSAGDA